MAEINIYGTLVNDTAEAIAHTTQVIDPATGKNVNEMIEAAKASAKGKPWLTAMQANATTAVDLTSTTEWANVTIPLETTEQGVEFPTGISGGLALKDYCGIAFEQNDGENIFLFPFGHLYDDGDLTGAVEFLPVLNKGNLQLYMPYLDFDEDSAYVLKFKKLEFNGSALTPWQQSYLEGLEKQEMADKFTATMTLSQTQKDFDGTSTIVTIYVTPKFDGSNVDAVVTGTSSNLSGKTFTKGSDGRYSTQVTVNAPASVGEATLPTTFSVSVKYTHPTAGQLTKTLSATHTQNVKSYILKSTSANISDLKAAFASAYKSANSIKGSQSIAIADGGEYVFFVVPKVVGDNNFGGVKSSGFDVPLTVVNENAGVTYGSSTVHYKVFRTTSKPQTSPFNIVIS